MTPVVIALLVLLLILGSKAQSQAFQARKETLQKVYDRWDGQIRWFLRGDLFVPREYILAIICVESAGDPRAQNPADPSRGLMQITPGALAEFNQSSGHSLNFDQMYDPDANLLAGIGYFRILLARTGVLDKATMQYNAGKNVVAGTVYWEKVKGYLMLIQQLNL